MGSLLGKIYSGLLHGVQLWVTIAEIGMDAIISRWPWPIKVHTNSVVINNVHVIAKYWP